MIYLIFGIIFLILFVDALSEALINGGSIYNGFKSRWYNRFLNFSFHKNLQKYNNKILENGHLVAYSKEVFSYLDYDEYIVISILDRNKVIKLRYSITNDEITSKVTKLSDLIIEDSYYGRTIKYFLELTNIAKIYDKNVELVINKIAEDFPEINNRKKDIITRLEYLPIPLSLEEDFEPALDN